MFSFFLLHHTIPYLQVLTPAGGDLSNDNVITSATVTASHVDGRRSLFLKSKNGRRRRRSGDNKSLGELVDPDHKSGAAAADDDSGALSRLLMQVMQVD
jgi:hypothetical protein